MLYNKTQFKKVNDKKVLHKVRKQWVVLSMSMLALLGGGVVAEYVSAHADTADNNQDQSTLKDRLNQSLSQFNKQSTLVQSPAKVQSARNNTYNGRQLNNNSGTQLALQNITDQASVLHNRIIANANADKYVTTTNNSHQQTSAGQQTSGHSTTASTPAAQQTHVQTLTTSSASQKTSGSSNSTKPAQASSTSASGSSANQKQSANQVNVMNSQTAPEVGGPNNATQYINISPDEWHWENGLAHNHIGITTKDKNIVIDGQTFTHTQTSYDPGIYPTKLPIGQ